MSVGLGSPRPKKFKTQPSAGKVIATVFWDAQGIIMLGLSSKEKYSNRYVLCKFARLTVIREKRRGKLSKGILLQPGGATYSGFFIMVNKSKKYRLWSNMALGLKSECNFWR